MADRYYWLKLKEDFFQQDPIEWLEEQENGKEYSLFYLKLCLKSLKNNGELIRQIGTKEIPYTIKKLAEITNTSVDIAEQAVEILKEIGLLIKAENGVLEIPEVSSMVGNETSNNNALRQKRFRDKQRNAESNATGVTESVTDSNASVTQSNAERNGTSNAGSNAESNATGVTESNESIEYRDKSIDNSLSNNNPIYLLSPHEETYIKAIKSKANNSSTVALDTRTILTKEQVNIQEQGFNRFWEAYPRKMNQPTSRIAWRGLPVDETLYTKILAAIEAYKRTPQWQDVSFIPYPATFLQDERWNDDIAAECCVSKQRPRGKPKVNDVNGAIAQIKAEMAESGDPEWWKLKRG